MNKMGIRLCDEHAAQFREMCPNMGLLSIASMLCLPRQSGFHGAMTELPSLFHTVKTQADGCSICFQPLLRQPEAAKELMRSYLYMESLLFSYEDYFDEADDKLLLMGYEDGHLAPFVKIIVEAPVLGETPAGWFN